MATSLSDLLTATEHAATQSPRTPQDIAAAAAAVGHLGRALAGLRTDGISRAVNDLRERQMQRLAEHCLELAQTAPLAESRTTHLAAAAADATAAIRPRTGVDTRWAIAIAITDVIATISTAFADMPSLSAPAQRATQIATDIRRIQQTGTLDSPTRQHNAILDSPIPAAWDLTTSSSPTTSASPGTHLTEAMARLVHDTSADTPTLSIAEMLAVSLAASALSRAAATRAGTPERHAPRNLTAADGWAAVQVALAPFNDGSRQRHTQAPPHIHAALVVHRAAHDPTTSTSVLADAAQHLPALADNLRRSVLAWPTTVPVLAYARRLPYREGRVPILRAGNRSERLIRVDAVDLAPVHAALGSARVLSSDLADRLGHGRPVTAHRTWAAHHEQAHSVDGPDQVRAAQTQTYRRLHQPAPGPRTSRPR